MTSDNPAADQLVTGDRKQADSPGSAVLTKVALAVGVIALLASPISLIGWLGGAITVVLGVPGMQREASAKVARIAVVLGVAAILVATFFFTRNIA